MIKVTTVYVSTLILVGFVPLLAYGYVSSGSLGAELLRLYPTNAVVLALNAMVTVAVLLSYPVRSSLRTINITMRNLERHQVQLYAAIRVIEGHVGLLPIEETAADCSHTDEISRTSAPNMLTENGLRDSTDSIEWQGQGSEGPQTSTSRCVADVFLRLVVVLLTALVAAFVDNVGKCPSGVMFRSRGGTCAHGETGICDPARLRRSSDCVVRILCGPDPPLHIAVLGSKSDHGVTGAWPLEMGRSLARCVRRLRRAYCQHSRDVRRNPPD
eukprot:SAG31_NODE_242_length_19350_cov_3.043998_5_plen_271_part_00